jgi:exonuclease SbcC
MHGSEWGLWDLHIHTPSTTLANAFVGATEEEKWEKYLAAIEAKGHVRALGVTDYFGIDGYLKLVDFKASGRLRDVDLLLPNIELRVLPATEAGGTLNLHLIVNPTIVSDLQHLLFEKLTFPYAGAEYSATTESLRKLGQAIHNQPGLNDLGALRIGVQQFKASPAQVWNALKQPKLRDNALVAIASGNRDGYSGLRDSGLLGVRREHLRQSHIVLSGRPADREFWLGKGPAGAQELESDFGGAKPCVNGSDAHSLEKVLSPEQGRHTWIKADPTFEGLRQICFEPEGRVHIGEYQPATPVNRIAKLVGSFPSNTELRTGETVAPFCARGPLEVTLSPSLTCLIGARGSGKSTLLNLLHAAVHRESPAFFKKHELRIADAPVSAEAHVQIEAQGSIAGIDIIGQNDVESFAHEPTKLTSAVLVRLLAAEQGEQLRTDLVASRRAVDGLKRSLALLADLRGLDDERVAVERDLEGTKALIASVSDERYVTITGQLRTTEAEREGLYEARGNLTDFITTVSAAIIEGNAFLPSEDRNAFDKALRTGIDAALHLVEAAKASKPDEQSVPETELIESATQLRSQLRAFLAERGLKEENLAAAAGAVEKQAELEAELRRLRQEEARLAGEIASVKVADEAKTVTQTQLTAAIERVNLIMTEANPDKPIVLYWTFDEDAAENDLMHLLADQLTSFRGGNKARADYLLGAVKDAGPPLEVSASQLYDAVRASEAKHGQQLDAFLGNERNRAFWELAQASCRTDIGAYLRIGVKYDDRDLKVASFGQRCAAVLFVMLAVGNVPLVVDEPEAHLDSAIIANRLVPLLKARKSDRQVIFATHNANFVVNGDAELIHFIEMSDFGESKLSTFTIEDLEHRPQLLRLEGGKEAFKARESKYQLDAGVT